MLIVVIAVKNIYAKKILFYIGECNVKVFRMIMIVYKRKKKIISKKNEKLELFKSI